MPDMVGRPHPGDEMGADDVVETAPRGDIGPCGGVMAPPRVPDPAGLMGEGQADGDARALDGCGVVAQQGCVATPREAPQGDAVGVDLNQRERPRGGDAPRFRGWEGLPQAGVDLRDRQALTGLAGERGERTVTGERGTVDPPAGHGRPVEVLALRCLRGSVPGDRMVGGGSVAGDVTVEQKPGAGSEHQGKCGRGGLADDAAWAVHGAASVVRFSAPPCRVFHPCLRQVAMPQIRSQRRNRVIHRIEAG